MKDSNSLFKYISFNKQVNGVLDEYEDSELKNKYSIIQFSVIQTLFQIKVFDQMNGEMKSFAAHPASILEKFYQNIPSYPNQ